jgi:hypothetical protein
MLTALSCCLYFIPAFPSNADTLADVCTCLRATGVAALMMLPHLTLLDISNCLTPDRTNASATHTNSSGSGSGSGSGSSRQQVSLLALLQGATWRQQQQEQQAALRTVGGAQYISSGLATTAAGRVHDRASVEAAAQQNSTVTSTAAAAAAAASAAVSAPVCAPAFFSSLRHLTCSGVGLVFEAGLWRALQGLTHLDVSACDRFKGEGLTALTGLQDLVASGECVWVHWGGDKVGGL